MLKATIIFQQKGNVCYNAYGERFILPELYELETPFYVCYSQGISDYQEIIAAFQEKTDLIEWIGIPLNKMVEKKRKVVEDIARENMERFAV